MQLSKQALDEFKTMLERDHPGQKFTDDQVVQLATKVMQAVRLVYPPLPEKRVGLAVDIKLAGTKQKRYPARP